MSRLTGHSCEVCGAALSSHCHPSFFGREVVLCKRCNPKATGLMRYRGLSRREAVEVLKQRRSQGADWFPSLRGCPVVDSGKILKVKFTYECQQETCRVSGVSVEVPWECPVCHGINLFVEKL